MKSLVLTESQWRAIRSDIDKNYPRSVSMVRWKMREVLGFTARNHEEWDNTDVRLRPITSIHLDFYDEAKRTMFLLKYSDIIKSQERDNVII